MQCNQCLLSMRYFITLFLWICCWFERTIITKIHHESFERDIAETYLKAIWTSAMELFCENSQWLKAVNYFFKKTPLWMLEWVLNKRLHRLTRSYHKVTKNNLVWGQKLFLFWRDLWICFNRVLSTTFSPIFIVLVTLIGLQQIMNQFLPP